MAKPLVAIIGRPNVGKSTFFNKVAGKRISIVDDQPGVTRDRIYADVEWLGRGLTLIDTGGIDPRSEDALLSQMREQAEIAMDTADVICFFTDARDGLTDDDREVANMLRKTQKPVLLVVNKIDYPGLNEHLYEFYELGLGDPIGISSVNMLGFGDLLDEIFRCLPEPIAEEEKEEHILQLAIVGRPNVGKSSLTNKLLGQNRTMVSDIAGTTRYAIDTLYTDSQGNKINIIDTAGIRDTDDIIEKMGVDKAKSKIEEADLVLYILDSTRDIDDEDEEIINLCKGKKTIVLLNKNDLSDDIKINEDNVCKFFTNVDNVPVIKTSMLKGNGIDELKDALSKLFFNGDILPKQEIYITNLRHKELLQKVYDSLKLVEDSISKHLSEDFYTVDLSNAYAYLGEIIGEEVGDDLVEEIFSKFCMGK